MKKIFFFIAVYCCALLTKTYAQSWSLTGNSATNSSTNFLGTKDKQALVFKTNNTEQMRILTNGKIGIGIKTPLQMLDVNGNINIGKGSYLFMENHRVLRVDSVGGNVFLGIAAGSKNISHTNTGIGHQALILNTSGSYNTAIGVQSLYSNNTGYENTATGVSTLSSNTSGYQNVANGVYALYFNTTGSANTATGYLALQGNTTGNNNTSYGYKALYNNVDGSQNVGIGNWALYSTVSAWGNTAVGYNAASSRNNGFNNTFIGANTDAVYSDIYNGTALGSYAYVTAPNEVSIGNSYVTSIGGYEDWTNISDGRVKKNIRQNVPGLAFINKLKPITYNLDLDAADKIVQRATLKDKDGKQLTQSLSQTAINARNAKQQIVYTGFVAQDVEKAAKELNYDFSGVDAAKNDRDLYGLRYAEFVVPLVKAVQELSKENDELKSRLEKLEAMMDVKQTAISSQPTKIISLNSASLEQNTPNPFNNTTTIKYTLPQQFTTAKIIITGKSGKTLKAINVSGCGKGSLNIDASAFASGIYQYSLIIDGRMIETKQMEHLK